MKPGTSLNLLSMYPKIKNNFINLDVNLNYHQIRRSLFNTVVNPIMEKLDLLAE